MTPNPESKFWKIIAAIGMFFAAIFYFLFNQEKDKLYNEKIDSAEKEAETIAKEKHEKIKDDNIAMANNIADILDKHK